ncbi:MAG: phosphoenolpyruvate--protein phosphotransferase [Acidobacteria bacterium]|nr:phosphoenolpyruvate--protein phosphotransferase [Acidobacteriota bacterium]MBI3658422.1 phosphoenolpyruvate--protein phosphotransferase [Acidobacteriota bacterium]
MIKSRSNHEGKSLRLVGQGLSAGVAVGRALVIESGRQLIFRNEVGSAALSQELARLRRAVERSKRQLQAIKKKLVRKLGKSYACIMDTHILMLEDKALIEAVCRSIEQDRVNAEWALKERTDKLIEAYASLKEEYFRERVSDVEDVSNRILVNLVGSKRPHPLLPVKDAIIMARSLNPSILAALDYSKVKAFALEGGGHTTHTAILARSLGIPAVIRINNLTASVSSGENVIVDGNRGYLIISPTKEQLAQYKDIQPIASYTTPSGGCKTLDGKKISLQVNAERLNQIRPALKAGAEGVGLFRSEFMLYDNNSEGLISEENQFRTYKALVEATSPYGVGIRTFDLGADKQAGLFSGAREINPALGLRGIRLSLITKDCFRRQIRAILRASQFGKLQIILPLISRIEEVIEAKTIIHTVAEELRREQIAFDSHISLGVMIEVPAAVLLADFLCREVDFFCVGTNDLIQYTLAVDRVDEHVGHLFEPFHPSVLRSIALVAKTALKNKIPVKVCGEAVANPIYAMTLLGMGITQFSLNLNALPVIHKFLQTIHAHTARALARKVCSLSTVKEIENYVSRNIALPQYLE